MDLKSDTLVYLDRFKPRPYQIPIFDAIENKGYKRVLAILPRRAGKDVCGFNLMLRQALRRVGVYYYVFPKFEQARRVIWDSITIQGLRFLAFIPDELIESKNEQQMKIRLVNGSLIQLVGSDKYDNLMGTNPVGIVFSEYALQNPNAYMYLRPILAANNGWALFLSTPRGRDNHLYEMYVVALANPDKWFTTKLTMDHTGHITREDIDQEIKEGLMSPDLIQQEFYTSFDIGIEGTYYGRYIDKMRFNDQIGIVPWEPSFPVQTSWDLGMADSTSILFYQKIGTTVRIIDCYENNSQGLEHYAKIVLGKPYEYSHHFAPHDIQVRELGTGMSRLEKARHFGLNFIVAPHLSLQDGIEAVRTTLPKTHIDEKKCDKLLKALSNYRKEYDQTRKVYRDKPLHDWSSHFCDAFRYMSLCLSKTGGQSSAEELRKLWQESKMPDDMYHRPSANYWGTHYR